MVFESNFIIVVPLILYNKEYYKNVYKDWVAGSVSEDQYITLAI